MPTADHHFHIGSAHLTTGTPCQDYALSGVHEQGAFAIVSDGCSTGRHTDVGSRILTLATAQAIRELPLPYQGATVDTAEVERFQQRQIFGTMLSLGLSQDDMLATCVYAHVTSTRCFVHMQGDGVVVFQKSNGEIHLFRYDWAENTPLYPMYANDDYTAFVRAHGGDMSKERLIREHWVFDPFSGFVGPFVHGYTLGSGIRGTMLNLSLDDLTSVAVCTDGVTQVDGIDWKDAACELMRFKTFKGVFAKRRMMRFIKDAQQRGRGPIDDIAYAVIRISDSEEKESS